MTDNTFKQNTFVIKEDGKIVWIEKMPEVPSLLDCQNIHFGKPDSDSGRMLQKLAYKQALQSAIANGIKVSNLDYRNDFMINGWQSIEVNKPFTLNCRVEIIHSGDVFVNSKESGYLDAPKALVTFPEDKPDKVDSVQWQDIMTTAAGIEPEAAGQEQGVAEAFLKGMKPQVADLDKHDKVAKVFDYYDMTGFAAQFASQQTASLQKQVEEMKDELSIVQELTALREDRTLFDEALKIAKRLQDKEKELHAAHTRIEELTAKNLKLLNDNNDLWDKVNNPKMKV
jgi:hypothetical protein